MAEVRLIEVKEEILADNIKVAAGVRENLQKTKTMLVNLMSSPGSGKTSLILQTIAGLKDSVKLGVIEADIDSMVDAEKVAAKGIRAVQLKTGGFCHLDATMVTQGIDALSVSDLDLVIIENKAVEQLLPIHEAQLLTYLKLSNRHLGFLINWNVPLVKNGIKRMVNKL